MRGHVVIDHNEYAVIDAAGSHDLVAAPELNGIGFTGAPELGHQLLGMAIKGLAMWPSWPSPCTSLPDAPRWC
jgi:hypothetical protein